MSIPIHICHIITDGTVGGAGVLLANLAESLDREKFRTSIILPKGSLLFSRLQKTDANLIQAEITPDSSIDLGSVFILRKLLSALRPDIVHTHGCVTGRMCAKLLGIPTLNTRHCDTKMKTFIYNKLTDFTVATSENMLKGMRSVPTENRLFIPNGAKAPRRTDANQRLQLKGALGIPENSLVIGSVGRLERIKGFDVFISAAAILKEKDASLRFLIVGDGSERKSLAELSAALGTCENVIFCGHRENSGDYMNIFDIGVLASRGSETCPLALSEMMSLSIPTVASDIAGNSYMLKNGAGVLFKNTDANSLADAIFELCRSPEKRKIIGDKAKSRYEEEFTVRLMASRYENMYSSVLNRFKS